VAHLSRADPAAPEPPLASGWGEQRRVAADNQARVLAAARRLLDAADAADVDMRQIARAAGVGVGTVYRRFGDKAQLLAALLSEDERGLQDAVLAADPPLGHGAAPRERLLSFIHALVELTERNLNVLLATDATPAGRLRIGAYGAWRTHLVHLLGVLSPPAAPEDLGWRADLLLGALDPGLYAHQRRHHGFSSERIARNLGHTALVLASDPPTR
jgi:AcrR family transcriptional regulator